jgi:hypothetical protein
MSTSALLPCAILIPSLNRAHRLRELVANVHATTPELHRLLFCVGDPDSLAVLQELKESHLDDSEEDDKRYVTRMNKLVFVVREHIPEAKTVFFGSDDVRFHPGWLTSALFWMDKMGKSVVVVNDLRNPNGTQALVKIDYLDRAVFDSPGDAFHGGYCHNFADTEMFSTAAVQGELTRAMDSFVEHLHPLFGAPNAIEWDETYRVGAMANIEIDRARYEERMARMVQIIEGKA